MRIVLAVSLLAAVLFSPAGSRAEESAAAEDVEESPFAKTFLVVFGISRSYEGTRETARLVARRTGLVFSDRGLVFDEKGLRWPDDHEDTIWAGGYFQRRSNWCERGVEDGCISVESTTSYDGMPAEYLMAVAAVEGDLDRAKARLAEISEAAPDAYIQETRVYLGCLH